MSEALLAHRAFQGGAGSGVDVATAVHGGLIEFEMKTQLVTSLAWPAGLCLDIDILESELALARSLDIEDKKQALFSEVDSVVVEAKERANKEIQGDLD